MFGYLVISEQNIEGSGKLSLLHEVKNLMLQK